MKNSPATLSKLEKVLTESEYVIRYERGNFQSGYCVLEAKKVVVLNKFLDVEGKINTLIEIIPQLTITYDQLTLEGQKLYDEIMKNIATPEPLKGE